MPIINCFICLLFCFLCLGEFFESSTLARTLQTPPHPPPPTPGSYSPKNILPLALLGSLLWPLSYNHFIIYIFLKVTCENLFLSSQVKVIKRKMSYIPKHSLET